MPSRPPADAHRRVAQSLDRAVGETLRLSQPAQRQEDPGAIRPARGVFDSYSRDAVDRLIERHFKAKGRPLRFCHPRDLLLQVVDYCKYHNAPAEMTDEHFERAVKNYFAVM
jgi:hypothetical protein